MHPDLVDALLRALERPSSASSDFDLNPEMRLPVDRILRPAGVLMAVEVTENSPQVWLTKRSSALKHHPGQIAFPGGKKDPEDKDIVSTALREAAEEIGLPTGNVEILGQWSPHETVTGFFVTPVIGLVTEPFTPQPEPGEVEEVFCVPLAHVLNRNRFSIQSRQWRGQERRYYSAAFGPYYVWGATARILRSIAEVAACP